MGRPEVPAVEERLCRSCIVIVPEPGKDLLDCPGTPDLQGVELERVKVVALTFREVPGILE